MRTVKAKLPKLGEKLEVKVLRDQLSEADARGLPRKQEWSGHGNC